MGPDKTHQLTAAAIAAAAPLFALAQEEHAADDHAADDGHATATHDDGHGKASAIPGVKEGLVTGITAVVVFVVVAAILRAKVWPAITKGLDERAEKISSEIEAAAAARKQAAEALESYQQNLAEARAEAQKMLEETRSQQQALAADLKAKADAELNDMRDKARRDIEAAKRAALNEIYANAADMATQIAGKILAREVSPADHQRLVDESLSELQAASN